MERIKITDLFNLFKQKDYKPLVYPSYEYLFKKEPTNMSESTLVIKEQFLRKGQYVDSSVAPDFNQIVIHHTAGGSAQSSINWWNSDQPKVGTHFIIDRDGTIIQTVPLEDWIYHLYVKSNSNNIPLKYRNKGSLYDKQSIGIELCNYGYLRPSNGRLLTIYNKEVSNVIKLSSPYKGYVYWESYTKEQLDSLSDLLLYLLNKYPKIKNFRPDYSDIFKICTDALEFVPGIYTHTSYRTDKSDCYPHPDLINTLNVLKEKL